jgi:hypothetical protein
MTAQQAPREGERKHAWFFWTQARKGENPIERRKRSGVVKGK